MFYFQPPALRVLPLIAVSALTLFALNQSAISPLWHNDLLFSVRSCLRGRLQDILDSGDVQVLGPQPFIYNSWTREMWSPDIWQSGVRGQV